MTKQELLDFLQTAKHGDYVDFKLNGVEVKRARISERNNGEPFSFRFYICHDGELIGYRGQEYRDNFGFKTVENMELVDHDKFDYIRLSSRTMDNLRSGDIITDGKHFRRIFQVLGTGDTAVVFYSGFCWSSATEAQEDDGVGGIYYDTLADFKKQNFKLYSSEPETKPREVTMEEVCEKFGETVVVKKNLIFINEE